MPASQTSSSISSYGPDFDYADICSTTLHRLHNTRYPSRGSPRYLRDLPQFQHWNVPYYGYLHMACDHALLKSGLPITKLMERGPVVFPEELEQRDRGRRENARNRQFERAASRDCIDIARAASVEPFSRIYENREPHPIHIRKHSGSQPPQTHQFKSRSVQLTKSSTPLTPHRAFDRNNISVSREDVIDGPVLEAGASRQPGAAHNSRDKHSPYRTPSAIPLSPSEDDELRFERAAQELRILLEELRADTVELEHLASDSRMRYEMAKLRIETMERGLANVGPEEDGSGVGKEDTEGKKPVRDV